ncbi:MAG: M28 family metallopeptidase [Caldiserica bacterium]|nr:M28 family metallopeptidase [Caldisericota bacterium]
MSQGDVVTREPCGRVPVEEARQYAREVALNRRWVVLVLIVFTVAGCGTRSAWPGVEKVVSEVDAQRTYDAVVELASPAYAGRRTGTPGESQAAAWIASQFKQIGLRESPAFKEYLSTYKTPLYIVNSFTGIKASGTRGESFLGDRGMAMPYAGSGSVEADAVLAGFGVQMTGYDEYAGLDVVGKVVVLLRYSAPTRSVPESQTYLAAKVGSAGAHGAAGVLILDVPSAPNPFDMHGQFVSALPDAPVSALVSLAGARSLFWAAGLSFDDLVAQAWAGQIVSRDLNLKVSLGITASWTPDATAFNVAGLLPGKDDTRPIMVCAHFDHLGTDRSGVMYPGADDDASGVAVMLEVARSIVSLGATPPVSIWFVAFSGEEEGLLGSTAFVKADPELAQSLSAVLDLDMMRSTSGLGAAVDPSSQAIMTAVSAAIQEGASLAIIPWTGGSDHETFSRLGVPSCMFAGHGREASWYHSPTDTAEDFPAAVLGTAARDVLRVVWRLMGSL